jgi:membrane-associated phospholipid phosphatase
VRAIQKWLLTLAVTICAVVISYLWLDRPIALLVSSYLPHRDRLATVGHAPDPFGPMAVVIFISLGLLNLTGRPLSKNQFGALLCSISLIIAQATKNLLKFAFGRPWPQTWVANNVSFVKDGAYGFNPFHGGVEYASFPSGHCAIVCAVVAVLWIIYPKHKIYYAIGALAAAFGLVAANFHFLSDVIAGSFVGVSIGWMTVAMWKKSLRTGAPN